VHITWCEFEEVMNGRLLFESIITISNIWWWFLAFTNVVAIFQHLINDFFYGYLDDFVVCYIDNIFMFPRTWRNMNNMFDLFWTSSKKLDFILSWKNVNSIKPKWNSLNILSLKMAFTWILVWSLNHCGLDYPRFYSWCSMFFGFFNVYQQF